MLGKTLALLSAIFATELLVVLTPVPLLWSLAIVVATAIVIFLYYRAVRNTKRERAEQLRLNAQWKLDIEPEEDWTHGEGFDKVRGELLDAGNSREQLREDRVLLITQQHVIFLWSRIALPILVALGCIFIVFAYGNLEFGNLTPNTPASHNGSETRLPSLSPTLPNGGGSRNTVDSLTIPWWIPLLVALICGLVVWVLWIQWKSYFFMVAKWNLYQITVPPAWLPFWQPDPQRLAYDGIDVVNVRNTLAGNLVGKLLKSGWGTLVVDTASTADRRFNRMRGLPEHRHIAKIIESAKISNKAMFSPRR